MNYKYIRILHEGEDYILVKYGQKKGYQNEYEITGISKEIIKTLLKRINS